MQLVCDITNGQEANLSPIFHSHYAVKVQTRIKAFFKALTRVEGSFSLAKSRYFSLS